MPYTKAELGELIETLVKKHGNSDPKTERILRLYGNAMYLGDRPSAVQLVREIPCDVIGEDNNGN